MDELPSCVEERRQKMKDENEEGSMEEKQKEEGEEDWRSERKYEA